MVEIAGYEIGIEQILSYISVGITIAASVIIAWIFRYLLRKSVMKKLPQYVYVPIEKLIFYGIIILGAITALRPLGFDLSGLLVAGGIVGIVIGFASQTVVANLLSGLFLFIDRPLKIGDAVKVEEGVEGRVVDISIFSTKIRKWDGCMVRVPNDKLFNNVILNFEGSPIRRVEFKIGISYSSDIEKAKKAILSIIEEHPFALVQPPPDIFVDDYGNSAIVLNVRCWAPSSVWFQTKKEIISKVKEALDKAGIEIPFPQRVVWLKKE